MSALQAETAENPRAVIGGNNPPPDPEPTPTPFDLSKQEIDDLFLEATNWCDGAPIADAEQAAAVERLAEAIQAAIKLADERRAEEKRPHDLAAKEVQDRYNTLIGDNKTVTGIAIKAKAACLKALQPWRKKVEEEKAAAAAAARAEADRLAEEARQAIASSNVDDLAARHEAEEIISAAKSADKLAARAEKSVTTGNGLRNVTSAEVTDTREFAAWVWVNQRAELDAFLADLASQLTRQNVRGLPGVTVHNDREARI